jgi:hypothetical protein
LIPVGNQQLIRRGVKSLQWAEPHKRMITAIELRRRR